MLVLGRKVGERIVVPECKMMISILSVRGNRVRVGISAPKDISIMREELVLGEATTNATIASHPSAKPAGTMESPQHRSRDDNHCRQHANIAAKPAKFRHVVEIHPVDARN